MLKLSPLTESDFQTLINWIQTPELLYQFAGEQFFFPLTIEQLEKYIQLPQKKAYKAIDVETEEMVAHGEFNFMNADRPRLSRIMVDPKLQRKGLGLQLVRLMTNKLFELKSVEEIDLLVFDHNTKAINCYEKVGFEINPKKTTDFKNAKVEWKRLCMELARKNWKS